MAHGGVGGGTKPVLLGFVDEFMGTAKEHFTTNKIGGFPDWCVPTQDPPVPLCGECGQQLLLVTQIYAPLSASLYHRTLYIFGCIQPRCWNKTTSWACLRAQVKDKVETKVESSKEAPMSSTTDWLDGADDWGDDANDNDDNGNLCSISPDTSSPSPVGAVGGFPNTTFNVNDPIRNNLDCENTLDIPMNNLNIKDGDRSQVRSGKNLNDNNANLSSPGRGASAHTTNTAATAEIEMEGEDSNIAIDSPEVANKNIPNLFALANRDVPSTGLMIEPFYIWVQEETFTSEVFDHEMCLLNEYKAKEALEHVVDGGGKGSKTGVDTYEKAIPSHGDEYFHKFISMIQSNPGQVLRYGRESQNPPLLLRPIKEENHKCRHCGAESIFEVQLLPSLVAQLCVEGLEGAPVEFGTVLVMACQKSCWDDSSDQPRFETVVVQGELM